MERCELLEPDIMNGGQIYLEPDASSDEISNTLGQYGIAVLSGFLDGSTLEALKVEFENALAPDPKYGRVHAKGEFGITASLLRSKMPQDQFAATYNLFSSSWMKDIADRFYGDSGHSFNHEIFVNENQGISDPIRELPFIPHFDKMQTLKFFVYLTDTSVENGAMGVDLCSHIENRQTREGELKRTGSVQGVKNVKESVKTQPVEGPEGTLFIFDTDVTHNAGHVHKGNRRQILRGHTRASP